MEYPAPPAAPKVEDSAALTAMAKLPEPPPAPTFVADTTKPLADRVASLLTAKVAEMEHALATGGGVSMVDLQRLADQVAGKTPPETTASAGEYDWDRLDDQEFQTLHDLLTKARRTP